VEETGDVTALTLRTQLFPYVAKIPQDQIFLCRQADVPRIILSEINAYFTIGELILQLC
jgi:hypothetical protein